MKCFIIGKIEGRSVGRGDVGWRMRQRGDVNCDGGWSDGDAFSVIMQMRAAESNGVSE
jgi:hypothetical protein